MTDLYHARIRDLLSILYIKFVIIPVCYKESLSPSDYKTFCKSFNNRSIKLPISLRIPRFLFGIYKFVCHQNKRDKRDKNKS